LPAEGFHDNAPAWHGAAVPEEHGKPANQQCREDESDPPPPRYLAHSRSDLPHALPPHVSSFARWRLY
jgi:hypothetical protein